MEQYFASLSKQQTMLLLTTVTIGGAEAVSCLDFLPDEEGTLLKHRAAALLAIPREKRIPLLVQEMKRLVNQRRRQLSSAEAGRLSEVLAKEKPATVEVVLRALPSELANAVRSKLKISPLKLQREVRADVLSIVRWKLEGELQQAPSEASGFRFSDVVTLQQREVFAVCDRMGVRALATALAGLPEEERVLLFSKLSPDLMDLAQRAAESGMARKLAADDARIVIERFGPLDALANTIRSAGVHRLMRACVVESFAFADSIVERHPGDFGRLLRKWANFEKKRPASGDGGRADIVEQLERLARKGVIDRPMRLPPPPAAISRSKPLKTAAPMKQGSNDAPIRYPVPPLLPLSRGGVDPEMAFGRNATAARALRESIEMARARVMSARRARLGKSNTNQKVKDVTVSRSAGSHVVKGARKKS